ncbi:Uma2 family endonuclease [Acrocarpospora sp. B8E8]|uniref:Uma2 family endonuclease n=1 Tax=Acrocarpospora sp. B8E8 TaxID=3153572 RepID=UPI00325EACC7
MTTNGDDDRPTMRDVTSTAEQLSHSAEDVLANWPYPPEGGWTADDLDRLPLDGPHGEPDFFARVELVDGALVFMSPQKRFHEHVLIGLRVRLDQQAPEKLGAVSQMDLKLDTNWRPCPDIVVADAAAVADMARTFYEADEVHLVVEIVSPESAHRDRSVKPPKYAKSGIPYYWRVENHENKPVVYVFQLDPATSAYGLVAIHRGRLSVDVPFPIDIDLDNLSVRAG